MRFDRSPNGVSRLRGGVDLLALSRPGEALRPPVALREDPSGIVGGVRLSLAGTWRRELG